MRVLITGGAGFIGSHIADLALQQGHDVLCLDDLSTGRRDNVPSGAELAVVDIRDKAAVDGAFAAFKPDVVSHQAAQASVVVSVRDPWLDAGINVTGSLNVIEAALSVGAKKFAFASTGGAIYGEVTEPARAPVGQPPMPQSPYACSKFAVENYLHSYRVSRGLEPSVLRYSNVYGPRQDPHGEAGVVAIFASGLLSQKPLKIFARRTPGDGGCVRDYVYVADVAQANLLALTGQLSQSVINVCSGVPTTTAELLSQLEERLGRAASVEQCGQRPGDVERSVLDPGDAVGALGAPTAIADGLEKTARWFQERHGAT